VTQKEGILNRNRGDPIRVLWKGKRGKEGRGKGKQKRASRVIEGRRSRQPAIGTRYPPGVKRITPIGGGDPRGTTRPLWITKKNKQ